ncbi:MAG: hypothetical protein NC311_07545 [Muribaculaceae bacterium]|nr:hypothetical protein [Muribaculaceae bacterium]
MNQQTAINLASGVAGTLRSRDFKNGITNILGVGGGRHYPSTAVMYIKDE